MTTTDRDPVGDAYEALYAHHGDVQPVAKAIADADGDPVAAAAALVDAVPSPLSADEILDAAEAKGANREALAELVAWDPDSPGVDLDRAYPGLPDWEVVGVQLLTVARTALEAHECVGPADVVGRIAGMRAALDAAMVALGATQVALGGGLALVTVEAVPTPAAAPMPLAETRGCLIAAFESLHQAAGLAQEWDLDAAREPLAMGLRSALAAAASLGVTVPTPAATVKSAPEPSLVDIDPDSPAGRLFHAASVAAGLVGQLDGLIYMPSVDASGRFHANTTISRSGSVDSHDTNQLWAFRECVSILGLEISARVVRDGLHLHGKRTIDGLYVTIAAPIDEEPVLAEVRTWLAEIGVEVQS